jgi:hypothetical protein
MFVRDLSPHHHSPTWVRRRFQRQKARTVRAAEFTFPATANGLQNAYSKLAGSTEPYAFDRSRPCATYEDPSRPKNFIS